MMTTYRDLASNGISTRVAAVLVGISRATATRKPRSPQVRVPVAPVNTLSLTERDLILTELNSTSFLDLPPIQVFAQLLDHGTHLGSISTMYQVLNENKQVKERRHQARHPPRAVPELIATGPGQGDCLLNGVSGLTRWTWVWRERCRDDDP